MAGLSDDKINKLKQVCREFDAISESGQLLNFTFYKNTRDESDRLLLAGKKIHINWHMDLSTLRLVYYLLLLGAEVSASAIGLVKKDNAVKALQEAGIIFYEKAEDVPQSVKKDYFDIILDCGDKFLDPEGAVQAKPKLWPGELTHIAPGKYQGREYFGFDFDSTNGKIVETSTGTGEGYVRALKAYVEKHWEHRFVHEAHPNEDKESFLKKQEFLIFGGGKVGLGIAIQLAKFKMGKEQRLFRSDGSIDVDSSENAVLTTSDDANNSDGSPDNNTSMEKIALPQLVASKIESIKKARKQITIVELNPERCKACQEEGFNVIQLNANNIETIKKKFQDVFAITGATGVAGSIRKYFALEDFPKEVLKSYMSTDNDWGDVPDNFLIHDSKTIFNFTLDYPTDPKIFELMVSLTLDAILHYSKFPPAFSPGQLLAIEPELDNDALRAYKEIYQMPYENYMETKSVLDLLKNQSAPKVKHNSEGKMIRPSLSYELSDNKEDSLRFFPLKKTFSQVTEVDAALFQQMDSDLVLSSTRRNFIKPSSK